MDPQALSLIYGISLLTFVILVILAAIRIGIRAIEYKKKGLKIPALLPRDFFLFTGLAVPFIGVLAFRFFGITPSTEWWYSHWIIGSSASGIAGIAYWVWFEYFKIEK